MVLPPGHHQQVTSRRKFSRRERWLVGSVVAGLVILAVALAFSLVGPSQSTSPGCIDVTILSATGGASVHQCGADARSLCRSGGHADGYTGETAREIQAACRKVGLPVG
jgi:hypothetical protein